MRDDGLVDAIEEDYGRAGLGSRERAMLDYAVKLTLTPSQMEPEDVERLRDEGFTDGEILDVCQVTSYYNYVNRMADGLGVELEARWGE